MLVKKILVCLVVIVCSIMLSVCAFTKQDRSVLRAFPYPYRAMLSLQSHIDGTTLEEFELFHTYLNTNVNTVYGDGLGLDVGDSLWLFNANDGVEYRKIDGLPVSAYMTWFAGTDTDTLKDAEKIIEYWEKGWIDSIHSFGDFSRGDGEVLFDRSLAQAGWDAMLAAGVRPTVWINHGTATNKQNFGGYTPITSTKYQAGDDPNSPYYHTDMTLQNGIKFVWNSRNYSSFGTQMPLYLTKLRDGQLVWCFNAYTGFPDDNGGYSYTWTPYLLGQILTQENLDTLVERGEYAIVATHFGSGSTWEMLGEHNLPALRLLKQYNRDGEIMVVRSSRLLEYAAVRECLVYRANGNRIEILRVDDPVVGSYVPSPEQLSGITFYVDDSASAQIYLNGVAVEETALCRNPADETGRESIGFLWYPE